MHHVLVLGPEVGESGASSAGALLAVREALGL